MFDIGWSEFLLVIVIGIVVVGPKELPRVIRGINAVVRQLRSMAFEFRSGMNDLVRESELEDLKRDISGLTTTPGHEETGLRRELSGLRESVQSMLNPDTPPDTPTATPQDPPTSSERTETSGP